MNNSALNLVQGELERLYDLDDMMRLSSDVLGFDPSVVGGTASKGAFARSLVGYCVHEDALAALVDAILLTSAEADTGLRTALKSMANGELAPGTQVGPLKVVKKLAEGGLSVVYLAEAESGSQAALKVIRPEYARDRAAVHRFTTVSRVMQSLKSEGLAPIVGVGQLEDARPWVAAELIGGQSLSERIKRTGPLHINEARAIFEGVLRGLIALHKRGLVHGDVKAENVFVMRATDEDGQDAGFMGVLVDAGVERLLSRPEPKVDVTTVLPIIGTAKAMAPEQARGLEPDARSDVYGMGTLIYETLTGRAPFLGDSAIDVIAQHVSAHPDAPSLYGRKGWISESIDSLVLKCLEKDPSERYRNAEELLDALDSAVRRPGKRRPLDELAFAQARTALLSNPSDESAADGVEMLARESGAWDRAATVFQEASRVVQDGAERLSLLFKAARIYESDLKDPLRAEAAYQQILDLDSGNEIARRGLEVARRASGNYGGLLELLLDRIEHESNSEARTALLHEVATVYEEKLQDPENATIAWVQALAHNPSDGRAQRAIERLIAGHPDRANEALEALSEAAQQNHAALFGDQEQVRLEAEAAVTAARAKLVEVQAQVAEEAEGRAALERAEREDELAKVAELESRASVLQRELMTLESHAAEATQIVREARAAADERQAQHEAAHAEAERAVEQYELAETRAGQTPSPAQQAELAGLARQAEVLVDTASALEAELETLAQDVATAEADLAEREAQLAAGRQKLEDLEAEIAQLRGDDLLLEDPDAALTLSDDEAARLAAAEEALAAAEEALAAEQNQDEAERAARRRKDLQDLLQLYVLIGRWYGTRLGRSDMALEWFSQALSVEPEYDPAFEATAEIYRASQAWTELAQAYMSRAERSLNPVKARDFRTQAAIVYAEKLNDEPQARAVLDRVLSEDPAHEEAQEALTKIFEAHGEHRELASLLERRVAALDGDFKADARLKLAALYERELGDIDRAEAHYAAVAEVSPRKLDAWKGLERVYTEREAYEPLLDALRAQVDLAPTPRQRIALYERIGTLLEEEFVNYEDAISAFEEVVRIDTGHEGANTSLVRLYRQVGRYEQVVQALERLAQAAPDVDRKVALLLEAERAMITEIGSPERAISLCQRILELDPEEPEALSELARLESSVGDMSSALAAFERLADRETEPHKRAEHWVRAGKLLEDHGDRDGAISRYRKALDADRSSAAAVQALRIIYARRGDTHGAIEMLNHAIELASGDLERAELSAELGNLYLSKLEDETAAAEAFNAALTLDPTCTAAQVGLGEIAWRHADHEAAAAHLGAVLGRLDDLPREQAAEVAQRAGASYEVQGQTDKALDAFKRARDLSPDDLQINLRHAASVRKSGDAKAAERLYERLFAKFESELDVQARVDLLNAWGETQLDAGQMRAGIATFKRALELIPDDNGALEGLTRAHADSGEYGEVINLLQQRTRTAKDSEQRFELLVRTGDVFLENIRDRDAAAETYVMALDLQPNNRNLLSKLMAVYSDNHDWSRLIEVILRIADMVEAPDQLAKYYNTAATIAHKELGRFDEAANYYELALTHLPEGDGQAQFEALVQCLSQNQDWERIDRAYESRLERLQEQNATPQQIAAALDARAQVLNDHLGRTADALGYWERAQELDPGNRERRDMLTQIYTKEPKRYFQQAIDAHRGLLAEDPYRVESLQSLRRIYTSGKRPDESWCICQTLRCLQMADVDEEKFFKKYRLTSLPRAKRALDEDLYRQFVWHPAQDQGLTAIFATLAPAVIATQSQPLTNFGVDPRNYIDPASDSTAMGRMLHHVSEMTATALPEVYHCPNDVGGLSFLFAVPPAIGIGQGARAGGPQQALAFVAARHLSYYRPGHYIRQLVPTGTGLRTWLFAAIRMVAPKFPVPGTMENAIKECVNAIRTQLTGPQRDALRSLTQKLLEAAPELDMKGWMVGVDLSADRLAFVMSNDLKVSNAVIDASAEDASSITKKDRLRELLVYSVSEEYFELRKALGIALGG
jgi:tetratricopeptide (TPR) repeat protein/serine/threonine protein kinase